MGGANLSVKGQPIVLPEGDVHISETGQVSVDGVISSNLRVVSFSRLSDLEAIGNTLFEAPPNATEIKPAGTSITQRFLEGANVNVIESIVKMISLMRSFEMMTQTARSFSKDIDQKLIHEVGRV